MHVCLELGFLSFLAWCFRFNHDERLRNDEIYGGCKIKGMMSWGFQEMVIGGRYTYHWTMSKKGGNHRFVIESVRQELSLSPHQVVSASVGGFFPILGWTEYGGSCAFHHPPPTCQTNGRFGRSALSFSANLSFLAFNSSVLSSRFPGGNTGDGFSPPLYKEYGRFSLSLCDAIVYPSQVRTTDMMTSP